MKKTFAALKTALLGASAIALALVAAPDVALAGHNEAPMLQPFTGDCTSTATSPGSGATNYSLTCTKSNGTAFGSAAFAATGTSGATVPLLNAANTWSGAQSFGTISSAAATLTGGSINGMNIGATTAGTGAFTSLSATGTSSLASATLTGALSGAANTFSGLSTQTGGHVVGTSVPTASATLTTAQEEVCTNFTAAGTITLPASPTLGEKHRVGDCAFNASTYNITVKASSGNVENSSSGVVLSTNGQTEDFTYFGSTIGWKES